ncbi:C4-dicarboxylate ABC transporter, partial [Vibrio breoganii]
VFNLAYLELIVATFVVGYVAVRYYMNYKPHRVLSAVGSRL